jgi:hypothetical protein
MEMMVVVILIVVGVAAGWAIGKGNNSPNLTQFCTYCGAEYVPIGNSGVTASPCGCEFMRYGGPDGNPSAGA